MFKKKGFHVFLIGCLFGILFVFFVDNFSMSLPFPIDKILGFPVVWGGFFFGSVILKQACRFSEDPNWCMAGLFDGGPNDWFIYFSIYLCSLFFYGFLFWGIYRVVKFFKERKKKL